MQIAMIPFAIFNEPTSDETLLSLDFDCNVIFCDGSTFPNPAIGGAGPVIHDPCLPQLLELEYPINGITTNIGSDIEAMRFALEYVINHYKSHCERVIILTDCKFVVNSIFNK
ncbi:hypothetical protein RFI_26801 [Reticulomyxa filosa]|uniref:RNase H type-1 domain-containing protein n=1 Tax=Reticulomyxa filosa TaxID=46433 RepID=X6MAT2_RETFI|nr:hypothetical protein RFI_26801 [Reticulomyxa filosa]|eukprot:ETO10577.1 hypothetical protein RFI_26801 [Reticulomyxa filosa]